MSAPHSARSEAPEVSLSAPFRALLTSGNVRPRWHHLEVDGRTGVCQDCGTAFPAGKRGAVAARCPSCRRSRRTCPTCAGHLPRIVRSNGSTALPRYCSDGCKPRCTVPGCDRPQRKKAMCGRCYAIAHTGGDPASPHHRWHTGPPRPTPTRSRHSPAQTRWCCVCGSTPENKTWTSRTRRFCSPACERLWYRNDGKVPTGYNCANCAEWVDLARPGKRKRSDSKLCDDCKPWHPRSSATKPRDLAERDGPQCRLCGDEVDLDLTYPDRMCPSIDHVV